MKALGITIVIAGLLMFMFPRLINAKEEKIAGLVAMDKKEDNTNKWPVYSAGIAVIAGVIVLLAEKKKAK
jgi:uncharacterized membrane protein HdeD (DUF308 family)